MDFLNRAGLGTIVVAAKGGGGDLDNVMSVSNYIKADILCDSKT